MQKNYLNLVSFLTTLISVHNWKFQLESSSNNLQDNLQEDIKQTWQTAPNEPTGIIKDCEGINVIFASKHSRKWQSGRLMHYSGKANSCFRRVVTQNSRCSSSVTSCTTKRPARTMRSGTRTEPGSRQELNRLGLAGPSCATTELICYYKRTGTVTLVMANLPQTDPLKWGQDVTNIATGFTALACHLGL